MTVTNGLVLNGTALVGNPAVPFLSGNGDGQIDFAGSQTLGGNGMVIFGSAIDGYYASRNGLRPVLGGTTLTIGPGITIRGCNGQIGYNSIWGGPQNVTVINQGTVVGDVAGWGLPGFGIVVGGQSFINQGVVGASNGGWLTLGASMTTMDLGSWQSSGGVVGISGLLDNTGQTLLLNGPTNVLTIGWRNTAWGSSDDQRRGTTGVYTGQRQCAGRGYGQWGYGRRAQLRRRLGQNH